MTPKKQVSPAIRILRGERDASARATHLEAATRKFLVTTNERKQMSTTTNFKRIALVAVAALGLGVLSSVPSQAIFSGAAGSQFTLTTTAATGSLSAGGTRSDSTTAGTLSILALSLNAAADSFSVTTVAKTRPAAATVQPILRLLVQDTSTSTGAVPVMTGTASDGVAALSTAPFTQLSADSRTTMVATGAANQGYIGVTYKFFQESQTARVAGTYTYTAIVTPFMGAGGGTATGYVLGVGPTQTLDLTVTIAAAATDSLVASAATSTAVMSTGTADAGTTVDSAVSVAATASTTANAVILVTLKNVSGGTAARESITATTTVGTIGDGTTQGRSVTLAYTGAVTLQLRADGTAGTATISISSTSVTFATKTAVFYATTASTGVATKRVNTLSTGANAGAITAVFKDASGNVIGGNTSVYAFSDALTVVSDTASACTFDGANSRHTCSLTGVAAGKANITIGNATKSVVSAAIPVTVSTAPPATLKMAWNKATYAPGEKAFLSVWAVDSAGNPVGSRTIPNLLSGGISTTAGFTGTGTPTIPNSTTSLALAPKLADTDGIDSLEPVFLYTVYMPAAGGAVTVSATGGSSLPAAGQVEVKATATVTDNAAAALAAVSALATTVASLKTLITTLTNLVLKIQKKVKA